MAEDKIFNSNQYFTSQSMPPINDFHKYVRYNDRRSLIKTVVDRKVCILCEEQINIDDYAEHVASCTGPENNSLNEPLSSSQQSLVYNESIDDSSSYVQTNMDIDDTDEDDNERFATPRAPSPVIIDQDPPIKSDIFNENPKKYCVLCFNMIDESEFIEHISYCSSESRLILPMNNEPKIDLYRPIPPLTDDEDSISDSQHVLTCLPKETISEPLIKTKTIRCFSCNHLINKEDNLSREISCPSHHIYCLSCLQYSMKEFSRNNLIPLCHLTLCDYQLSQHDISLIPLERRISDRLIKLAKGQQRPQCPKCFFYIDFNEDFYEHIDLCKKLIPCEYCLCPYSIDQLDIHRRQCQNDKTSQNEKLTNFIIKRIKYSFTKEQIYFFIQQQKKKNYIDLNPLSIIDALAAFGPIFPYDIPTRECDIGTKARPYDDIQDVS